MTAALIDHRSRAADPAGPARDAQVRRPRLAAVPDEEPPLDEEFTATVGAPARSRPRPRIEPARPDPAGPPSADRPVRGSAAVAARRGDLGASGAATAPGRPRTGRGPRRPARPWLRPPVGPRLPGRSGGNPATAPVLPRPRRAVRPRLISSDTVPGWSKEPDVGIRMTTSTALPPAYATGAALTRALLEVLSGRRPIEQLRVHLAPDVFAGLQDAPMLTGPDTVRLLTTRVCEPADGVAELSAVFRGAQRVHAMAMRLQGIDGRWRVTVLQLG